MKTINAAIMALMLLGTGNLFANEMPAECISDNVNRRLVEKEISVKKKSNKTTYAAAQCMISNSVETVDISNMECGEKIAAALSHCGDSNGNEVIEKILHINDLFQEDKLSKFSQQGLQRQNLKGLGNRY